MRRRPPRSTRTDTLFPYPLSSDLLCADTFIIDAFDGVDTITDFEANGPTQDALDLTELLNSGGDWNDSGLEAAIELGYVRFTQVGANVDVSVDLGGFAGAGGPAVVATIENSTIADLDRKSTRLNSSH